MSKQKIKVLILEPFKPPYEQEIENDLKSLQEIVGGYIESMRLDNVFRLLWNEDGIRLRLKFNRVIADKPIVGNIIVIKTDGADFDSLSENDVKYYTKYFSNHA